jgi:predicted nucleic acid-binding Zn ribbon protein
VTYELRQGFSAETTHTCEQCGKGTAKRVLHAPRVVFKGSGWYATDSRKSPSVASEDAPAADSGGDKESDKKSEKKSDQKDAKKSASEPAAAAKSSSNTKADAAAT